MTRVAASIYAAMLALFGLVMVVAAFRLLNWLFDGQLWLWAALIVLPTMAAVIVWTVDSLSDHPDA